MDSRGRSCNVVIRRRRRFSIRARVEGRWSLFGLRRRRRRLEVLDEIQEGGASVEKLETTD